MNNAALIRINAANGAAEPNSLRLFNGNIGINGNGGRNPLGVPSGNGIISAIIQQKNAQGTILAMADGQSLNVRSGQVVGDVGDTVFFEVGSAASSNDGAAKATALKQVFPSANEQNILGRSISFRNLKDLMVQNDFIRPAYAEASHDIAADIENRLENKQAVADVVSRLSRNVNRITSNVHSAAVAELAAAGVNIDKVSIPVLDNVVHQLEGAIANNAVKVADELGQKLDKISGLTDGQIAQLLSNEAEITLDNLYIYKHSGICGAVYAGGKLNDADWEQLAPHIARFFAENELENNQENQARVRLILDNQIPLTFENFDKLVFLQDVASNVDTDSLLNEAVVLDYEKGSLGSLNIYEGYGGGGAGEQTADLPRGSTLQKAEARLAMSYEANLAYIGTDMEMDLKPQIEAIKTLKEKEQEIINALKELDANTEENRHKIAETFRSVYTLPYTYFSSFGALAENSLSFTLSALEQHITSHKYSEQATIIMMKYGDGFAKVAGQIAPLLRSLGFSEDAHNIRAAKILVMNNMEVNNDNIVKIKDMDAKLQDVQAKLHPRIAAQMVANGHNPAEMHMDDILKYIEQFNDKYGTSDNEELLKNIARMDKEGDIDPEIRKQVIEIYRMLNKVSKHGGAGIGYAVNAGIPLSLENLTEFSKNFSLSGARNNIINYTAEDGVYYAKHLVSSFIAAAKPEPLAEFVAKESLADPLAQSVTKLQNIAAEITRKFNADSIDKLEQELNIERINAAMKELSGTGREALRSLAALGLPVTLANLRQFKATKDKRLEKEDIVEEILSTLPNSSEIDELNPVEANENLTEHIEQLMDNAFAHAAETASGDAVSETGQGIGETNQGVSETSQGVQKINQMDIILQNLVFRKMLLTNERDFSFIMNFNGRVADVKLHLLSDNMSVKEGVTVYLSLGTAMGEVEGLLRIQDQSTRITIAAENNALAFIKQNRGKLAEMLWEIGLKDINFDFMDKNALKKQLSRGAHQPIY